MTCKEGTIPFYLKDDSKDLVKSVTVGLAHLKRHLLLKCPLPKYKCPLLAGIAWGLSLGCESGFAHHPLPGSLTSSLRQRGSPTHSVLGVGTETEWEWEQKQRREAVTQQPDSPI